MTTLLQTPAEVQPDAWTPIPPGVELAPIDPFSEDFPGHYPDEAPVAPDADGYDPSEEDADWLARETGGGWVEGQASPFDIELRTLSALQYFAEHLDPGDEPEPELPEYRLF